MYNLDEIRRAYNGATSYACNGVWPDTLDAYILKGMPPELTIGQAKTIANAMKDMFARGLEEHLLEMVGILKKIDEEKRVSSHKYTSALVPKENLDVKLDKIGQNKDWE